MKAHRFFSCLLLGGLAVLSVSNAGAQAKSYKVVHNFDRDSGDGSGPSTPPVQAKFGDLYGTTNSGGSALHGALYRIAPDGTETVLHSFDGEAGGETPEGPPTIDPSNGALYGTTGFGGTGSGYGILWKLTERGKFSVLHSFNKSSDGSGPNGQLVRDSSGNLYGVTASGGAHGYGTIFRYGANGKFKVLHAFAEDDGANPGGRLLRDKQGNLYGVTANAGVNSGGTAYKLAPDGMFTVLHAFAGVPDGSRPVGGLTQDKAGNLYGTTVFGGGPKGYGTVYKVTPKGTLTILYDFTGKTDGGWPQGDLLRLGKKLYGTTTVGGDKKCGCGVVFQLTLDGKHIAILHTFTGGTEDGNTPLGGVTKGQQGLLYGTTVGGGAHDHGIVFSVES